MFRADEPGFDYLPPKKIRNLYNLSYSSLDLVPQDQELLVVGLHLSSPETIIPYGGGFMKPLFVLLITVLFLSSCSEDTSVDNRGGNGSNSGMLKLFLTDAPIELDELWVTITEIDVHKTGGNWISFDSKGDSVDLLTLENRTQLVQSAPLETGKYTGIRLQLSEGHIIDSEGNRCELKIPSGKVQV